MRKKMTKPVVIVIVFLLSLVFFSIITNQVNKDLTTTMEEAKLPTITLYYEDISVDELHGYVTSMDITGMRDSILPLGKSRMMNMDISTYGMEIDSVSYQIRSMDGERLVADGKTEELTPDKQTIHLGFQIQNLLTDMEEYNLILTLDSSGKEIYYYTRIMQCGDSNIKEYLDFVNKFHEYTFRDDAASFIPTFMDPATGDATTLSYVDLSCTLKQVTWASFPGQVLTTPVMSVKEINDFYKVITMQYVVVSINEQGETEFYNVEEYYRLRMAEVRMYVLQFERTMNQIFRGENTFLIDSQNILLGIRNSNVVYEASEAGDVVAFVQEGELWCYHIHDNTIVQVFSFRGTEGIDPRENWDQHNIKIVRMDEAGSLDFLVYGYMNRGDHEGEVGIGIYHYDGLAHTVEEEAFLPSEQSYEILKAEMGQLMYENEQGTIFLMMEGNVYSIEAESLETNIVISGLQEGCYAISESNRYFAWVDVSEQYTSSTLQLMDLKTGKTREITDESEVYLRPLGFWGEDFIYGAAKVDNVFVNAAGNMSFPMEYLKILELETGEVLKQYEKNGRYIEGISMDDSAIKILLLKKEEGNYVLDGEDSIMNREADDENKVTVGSIVTDKKETQIILKQNSSVEPKKVKMILSKSVILEEARLLDLHTERSDVRYYVYVKGDVLLATNNISEAIRKANDNMGVVIDQRQRYLWMRARKTTQSPLDNITIGAADIDSSSIAQCISAILIRNGMDMNVGKLIEEGNTPKEILESALQEQEVLDLTGCTVEETLFYVSCQNPVFAMTGTNQAVLLIGYNSEKVFCYDPSARSTDSYTYEEAEEIFSKSGSIYFAYYDCE